MRVFANTVDVEEFGRERDASRAARRPELRERARRRSTTTSSCCPSRGSRRRRGSTTLVRAVAAADDPRLVLVLAGEGPERAAPRAARAASSACGSCSRATSTWERIVELYVAADVFALLSEREPWGVVVNEAAACGLPLVLSDRVGAAHDLLRDGENGVLVAGGDVAAAAARSASSPPTRERRRAQGARRASSCATGATARASTASSPPCARPLASDRR